MWDSNQPLLTLFSISLLMFLILVNNIQTAVKSTHAQHSCSYLSRYFSEKSTIVWSMGASMKAVCTACECVSKVQGSVWQSHSSNPWEALVELYIALRVWRRRTLGSLNPHGLFKGRFPQLGFERLGLQWERVFCPTWRAASEQFA